MKKITLLIVTLFIIIKLGYAQSFDDLKINITNKEFKQEVDNYSLYIKQWAVDNRKANYIISIDQDNFKDTHIITFNVIISKSFIALFNASYFTFSNGILVLIHQDLADFVDPNVSFTNFIINNYWIDKPLDKSTPSQTTSKDTEPLTPTDLRGITLPRSWILIFKNNKLISTTSDLHEIRTQ